MSLDETLKFWQNEPTIAANIAAWRTIPARLAQTVPLPVDLHPALVAALRDQGIDTLYTHQAEAWTRVQQGENPVIVTGTASGKTLCYNLPVLDHLLREPDARALYLFPTKALAQDQLAGLKQLIAHLADAAGNITAATYDGDTAGEQRAQVRQDARVVISNPDMLHAGILPHHTAWAHMFERLRYVIIDEIHTYRGVFGSHVANVIRRLKRIAKFYGAQPQFILTSATIANPLDLAGRLVEERVTAIDQDGAPRGEKHVIIFNPPPIEPELGIRRSALTESVRLAGDLLAHNVQTILFGRTRRSIELALNYLRAAAPDHAGQIRGYRSGYLPRQRREIEQGLRTGDVRAVAATTALELGIDIGSIEAVIMAGYPGTIAGTWQQAGRAGRTTGRSLAMLVASADPLDQFLARHPDYLFDRPFEQALINPDNPLILLGHLRCAAFELPFYDGEPFGRVSAEHVGEFLAFLQEAGALHRSGKCYFWMAEGYPSTKISLRSTSPNSVVLQTVVDNRPCVIGQVDAESMYWMVHPGAIYIHEGTSYLVQNLDAEQGVAHLIPVEVDYYTQPRSQTDVQLIEKLATSPARGAIKAHGKILVTTQVIGYRRVRWFTHEQLDVQDLDLPPSHLQTTGYWLSPNEETVQGLREQGRWTNDANLYGPNWAQQKAAARARDGYRCQMCGLAEQGRAHDVHHKIPFRCFESYVQANRLENLITLCPACHRRAEQAVRIRSGLAGLAWMLGHLAPLFLMCDPADIGVHADSRSPLTDGRPAVVIYDQVPAGIGFSECLFQMHDQLLERAYKLITGCPCEDGCPSCVGPAGEKGLGSKDATLALLEALIPGHSA